MLCPKCRGSAMGAEHAGITVGHRTACGGMWFEGLRHLEPKKARDAGRIDAGPEAGRAIRREEAPAVYLDAG